MTLEQVKQDPRYQALPASEKTMVDYYNAKGIAHPSCSECRDSEYLYITPTLVAPCECRAARINARAIATSGLTEQLRLKTFSTFQTHHEWQHALKRSAIAFCKETGKWFYAGGQVGCGKTHICTAIINTLMGNGLRARYMVWPNEVHAIKGNVEDFSTEMRKLMDVPVLYIDDFLKTAKERWVDRQGVEHARKKAPTPGELTAAISLLWHRYNADKTTILSSEFTVEDIMTFDSGLGSRIHQKTEGYQMIVGPDEAKNLRIFA